MRERRGWTPAEDDVLRLLREERGELKWSCIARTMQLQFGITAKTGKQCRQRYHNHLEPAISHADWQPQEDALLLQLHRECGNKWSAIALNIPGRTENCVKNHFYSKLRKVVRRLTRSATGPAQTPPSTPSLSLLSRIVAASECRFRPGSRVSEQWVSFAADLVEKLYNFQSTGKQDFHETRRAEREIMAEMAYFQLNFKKRKCGKRAIDEDDYRNRRSQAHLKRTAKDRQLVSWQKEIKPISQDQVKIEGCGLPDIFPVKTSSSTTNAQMALKEEAVEAGVEEGVPVVPGLYQGALLKVMPSSFMTFCELDEWEKVHMLEESEEYAYHYNPLQ